MMKFQNSYQKNKRPYMLGKMRCFWYDEKNNPRLVLGPDWIFSVVEIIILNGIGIFLAFNINMDT